MPGAKRADGRGQMIRGPVAGEVVVFHHDHVVEPEAVVHAAAREDGGLFQRAQAGRGFARVEDARPRAGDGLDKTPRERGGAGKALDEIQRDPLGGEDRAHGAADFEDGVAFRQSRAVLAHHAHFELRIDPPENLRARADARCDGALFGKNPRASLLLANEVARREIARPEVLGERNGDGIVGQRHVA